MPPFDKKGGLIDLNGPFIIRGDDAKEYILPGSIPVLGETEVADQEEHDCLPPLESTDKTWTLSARLTERLLEQLEKIEEACTPAKQACAILAKTCRDMSEAFASEGIIQPPAIVEQNTNTREWKKYLRWKERNRKRRLKGLPEKRNPYPRVISYTYAINLKPSGPIDMKFVMEGDDGSED